MKLVISVFVILLGCTKSNEPLPNDSLARRSMLDLTDSRWSQYASRTSTGVKVAELLQASPKNNDLYYRILHECCDLETFEVYPVAYLAYPHLERLASESSKPEEIQWSLAICAAICSNFKTNHGKSSVPSELWDDFIDAVNRSTKTASSKIQLIPTDDPAYFKFMMIQPVLMDIETKPLFGAPEPKSFILFDWFEERRPENL
ncbi:MAG: hypothetical protein U0930_19815 [Pirellulales bacterium]